MVQLRLLLVKMTTSLKPSLRWSICANQASSPLTKTSLAILLSFHQRLMLIKEILPRVKVLTLSPFLRTALSTFGIPDLSTRRLWKLVQSTSGSHISNSTFSSRMVPENSVSAESCFKPIRLLQHSGLPRMRVISYLSIGALSQSVLEMINPSLLSMSSSPMTAWRRVDQLCP